MTQGNAWLGIQAQCYLDLVVRPHRPSIHSLASTCNQSIEISRHTKNTHLCSLL